MSSVEEQEAIKESIAHTPTAFKKTFFIIILIISIFQFFTVQNNDNPFIPTRSIFFIFSRFFENLPTKSRYRLSYFSFSRTFRQEFSTQKGSDLYRIQCKLKGTLSPLLSLCLLLIYLPVRLLTGHRTSAETTVYITVYQRIFIAIHAQASASANAW